MQFSDLLGMTMQAVTGTVGGDEISFVATNGRSFKLWHCQDCCENVTVEDIIGDLADLVGSPILMAEEINNADRPIAGHPDESETWTFYKLATAKGYVTIRWCGSSNGYYSESVDFVEVKPNEE